MTEKNESGSAYFIVEDTEIPRSHVLSIIVNNEPGVLARVIGLFSGRGYNIESLTVSETSHEKHLSRITIVSSGTMQVLDQIKKLLERSISIHKVVDLTLLAEERGHSKPLQRELGLIKVACAGKGREEALNLAQKAGANVIHEAEEHLIFEITGKLSEVEAFYQQMKPLGLIEVCRTGVAALGRSIESM